MARRPVPENDEDDDVDTSYNDDEFDSPPDAAPPSLLSRLFASPKKRNRNFTDNAEDKKLDPDDVDYEQDGDDAELDEAGDSQGSAVRPIIAAVAVALAGAVGLYLWQNDSPASSFPTGATMAAKEMKADKTHSAPVLPLPKITPEKIESRPATFEQPPVPISNDFDTKPER